MPLRRPFCAPRFLGEAHQEGRQGEPLVSEATFVPLSGFWLLVQPPSDAPSPPAASPPRVFPAYFPVGGRGPLAEELKRGSVTRISGRQLGQQCCPMLNMAKTGHQHKGRPSRREMKTAQLRSFAPQLWAKFSALIGPRDAQECNGRGEGEKGEPTTAPMTASSAPWDARQIPGRAVLLRHPPLQL
jgi:hypothetical protein